MRRQVKTTGAFIILGGLAALAFILGSTFQMFLTIFSILVWTVVGLMAAYMILFRNVKFTLFQGDPEGSDPDLPGVDGFDRPQELIPDSAEEDQRA